MKKIVVISALSLASVYMLHSKNNSLSHEQFSKENNNQIVVLNESINGATKKGPGSSLQVKISLDSFRELKQHEGVLLREFVAKNDIDDSQWSEIISVTPLPGKGVSAIDWRNGVKQSMYAGSKNPKIIEENVEDFGSYKKASFVMSYKDERKYLMSESDGTLKPVKKNRRELIVSHHYSGPRDAVNFQYSIALINGMTEQEALKKIKDFEKNYVHIVAQ